MATGLVDKSFVSSNDELFYLKWNNFQKNVSTQFEKLREEDDLVDITFACEGRKLTAHKLVLFACSPFFKELLKKNPSPHPVFFMNDVKYDVLKAILEYMYLGEVHITNENLKDFIKTAEGLQIRGLSKENNTDLPMPPAAATPQTSSSSASVSHMVPIGRKVIIDDKETIVTAENVQLLDELCRKRPVVDSITSGGGGDITGQVVGLNIKRIKTTVVESSQIQSDGSEPKVEMVEYLDAETTNHQSPTYCSMDNFTEKSNSRNNLTQHMGQINTATFTQTPTQPSSSGHQQQTQQQQQQQQQHVQHEYKSEEDSSWMDKSLDNISVNSEHQQQQQQQPGQQGVKYKGKSGGGGGGSSRSQRSTEDKTNCLTPRCCPVCSRLYSNVSNLRQHMRLIHNPTAVCCPICQKHFNSELYLKRHYSSIHSINAGTGTGDGGELVEQKPQPAQLAAQQTPQQQQQHQGQQQQQQQTNNQQQQQQQQQQAPTSASTNTWNPYHHESQLVNPFIK